MKIGELACRGGTTAKTIRFYEQAALPAGIART
jgi:DNA-binding transcriptional MerR regulator